MRRLSTLFSALVLAMALSDPAAAAKDIARIPLCDLDGHCDRTCVVSADEPFVRCGY